MELKMVDGGYVVRNGRLERVSGSEETAQRIMMKLSARRGAFPMMPEFGSRLYLLSGLPESRMKPLAVKYISEALSGERGVTVESVEINGKDDAVALTVRLAANGETLSVTTEI